MKHLVFALIVFAGFTAQAQTKPQQAEPDCVPTSALAPKIKAQDKLLNNTNGLLLRLALSNRYCFDVDELDDERLGKLTTTRTDAGKVIREYKEGYRALETDEQKMLFVDRFLKDAAKRHALRIYERDNALVVVIRIKTKSGGLSGYGIRLFSETPDGREAVNTALTEKFLDSLAQ